MLIIQALKELPLIDKKVASAISQITNDSAILSNERSQYEDNDKQKAHVASLLQSVKDMMEYADTLRRNLAYTNATTTVTINGKTRTISEWISYRQNTGNKVLDAFNALTTRNKAAQLRNVANDPVNPVHVLPMYNEVDKQAKVVELTELFTTIDTTLEVFNATTELKEPTL